MLRPPIVTVMGHVDHGKTSLLDALRGTNVVKGESGGITQHMGASQITYKGSKITFIDTPGHEAFSAMRMRGGKVADIAIIVVAANDGVKPQTREAIEHTKAFNVPVIVAINKIDLEGIVLNKVKKQLYDAGLALEEFGGDVICVEVSATLKKNLDKLLDSIVALASIIENPDSSDLPLKGLVVESSHDPRKGYVANIIVLSGILKSTHTLLLGNRQIFKIKAIIDGNKKNVTRVECGAPAQIMGLKDLAFAGEMFEEYKNQEIQESSTPLNIPIKPTNGNLNVILRTDTVGTLEAVTDSLSKLVFEDKTINIVLKGVGEVKEGDVNLANATNSIIVSFKSKINSVAEDRAKEVGVLVRNYDVIYNLLEDLAGALEGIFEVQEEKVRGKADILKIFPLGDKNFIAGCLVTHGRLKVGDTVEIYENETPLFRDKIKVLKKSTQKSAIIGKDTQCGVLINNNSSLLKEGQTIIVL